MNVLNIDLDFFLNDRITGRADDIHSRPGDRHNLIPWEPDQVIQYLEGSLHLTSPVPGSVVSSHHEVFFKWRDLIAQQRLSAPFFVCHVDAHADLGCGMPSWVYLHSDFLELPLADRHRPSEGVEGLNFGSYLAFAIGCRWISQLDFVVTAFWRDDISPYLLADEYLDEKGWREFAQPNTQLHIELMHAPRAEIEAANAIWSRFTEIRKAVGEPVVPFNIVNHDAAATRYESMHWDFIFLSHSPGYVPLSADALLPVISAYIDSV